MEDCALEDSFADVVIKRRARNFEEEGELRPVVKAVFDGFSEGAVGFDLFVVDTLFHPTV